MTGEMRLQRETAIYQGSRIMRFTSLGRYGLLAAIGGLLSVAGPGATSQAAEWKPAGPIKLMIGFRAGGGTDTQSRLIAEELEKRRGWKIIPENVAGKGGVVMSRKLMKQPADGLSIGMAVTESYGYNMIASKKTGYKVSDFTFLTTTTGSNMGIYAKVSRGWKTIADVVAAVKGGKKISIGTMSPKLADGAFLLGEALGIKFNIVTGLRGGKGIMNALVADDIDIGWGAGIQTKGVRAGRFVNLASGEIKRLKMSPNAPTMTELGVPFDFGAKFVFVAPAGISADARATLTGAIQEIVRDPSTKASQFINRSYSGPDLISGAALDAFIENGIEASRTLLKVASGS
jgi:tripartite-type tricarboxylate transporter receptor subunit TctC